MPTQPIDWTRRLPNHATVKIGSSTFAGGNAGPVTVNANTISADGGAQTAFDTGIVSNANLGLGGNAGPITVTANTINLSNHGVISSDTFGGGNAGEIHVTGIGPASSLTVDGGNRVPATGIVTDAEQGLKGAAGSVTGNRPARGRARRYLTVSVPYIPAARWPGAWQKNV